MKELPSLKAFSKKEAVPFSPFVLFKTNLFSGKVKVYGLHTNSTMVEVKEKVGKTMNDREVLSESDTGI